MLHKVLIFGHSFVHRLGSFAYEKRDKGWYNLGFDGTEIQVEYSGLGGGTLRPGPKSVQKADFMKVISLYQPGTVFLQIGGNDLDREDNPISLARDIISFANYLITCYDVSHVIVGQLIPRFSGTRSDYNDKVIVVNNHLELELKFVNNITFWKHRGIWKNTRAIMSRDNVHFNDICQKCVISCRQFKTFLKSIPYITTGFNCQCGLYCTKLKFFFTLFSQTSDSLLSVGTPI